MILDVRTKPSRLMLVLNVSGCILEAPTEVGPEKMTETISGVRVWLWFVSMKACVAHSHWLILPFFLPFLASCICLFGKVAKIDLLMHCFVLI